MMKEKTQTVQLQKRQEVLEKIAKLVKQGKAKKETKELLFFLALLSAAILGRVALQYVPSVEPIIPFAILAGLLFGMKEGFMLGGSAYIISNFFIWGLQGPWTIFQALGAAVPGAFAGFYGKTRKIGAKEFILLAVAGTLFFETLMNVSGAFMGIGLIGALGIFTLPLYFAASLPFSLVHTVTNAGFARLLVPLLSKWRRNDEFKIVSVSKLDSGKHSSVRLYKSESN
ncbi:MAG TPA: ECF transporter S component [Candidatus Diapherotrites archaeon]|uniref:ECF transporter S component n=1 Tax=Candidatus Iainarchaeum sp. TaxID=3101447 RepID=A0A7J4KS56_9ARCH|nr:ECF transporter S component [Candidatus Diapherotrites archaeon]